MFFHKKDFETVLAQNCLSFTLTRERLFTEKSIAMYRCDVRLALNKRKCNFNIVFCEGHVRTIEYEVYFNVSSTS